MKKIFFFTALIILVSCDNLLDLKPTSELTAQGFWQTEEGAKAAQIGLHSSLRSYSLQLWQLGELRSDIWGGKTLETPRNIELVHQTISATQVPFQRWGDLYQLIHKLNDFIINVPNVDFANTQDRDYMLGQAHGLRAYVYYVILKTWGKAPITTEAQLNIDIKGLSKGRSSEKEVMDLIKKDIELSLDYYKDNYSFYNGLRTYWSKSATLVLKGDVYIWSGNHLDGGNADFNIAKNALEELKLADLKLLDNYKDIFDATKKNNKEIIFALHYERDQQTNFYGDFSGRRTEINPLFDEKSNSLGSYVTNGYSGYGPNDDLLMRIDDRADTRRDATFKLLYTNNNGYDTFNSANYRGSILVKFSGIIDNQVRLMVNDVPVYRYADALLLLAEAKNLLGEDPSPEINQIRKRAYGVNYTADKAFVNGTKDENITFILEERLKEFIGEGKRWWDLRRAGDKWVIMNNKYLDASQTYKLVLPISEDMMGRNPLLEQTEGY